MSEEKTQEEQLAEATATITDLSTKLEGMGALQESITKLENNNRLLVSEQKESKTNAQKAIDEAARKSGDVETIENSWKEKLTSETTAFTDQLNVKDSIIAKMTSGAEAMRMASEFSIKGSADTVLLHIEKRLTTEIKDGVPTVRVLDKSGKPSAMTLDDLKDEIVQTESIAPLISGSKASGSGDIGDKGKPGSSTVKREAFDAMNPRERASFFKQGGSVV